MTTIGLCSCSALTESLFSQDFGEVEVARKDPGTFSCNSEEDFLPWMPFQVERGWLHPASPSSIKQPPRQPPPGNSSPVPSSVMSLCLSGLLFLLVISLPSGKMVGTDLIMKVGFFRGLKHLKTPVDISPAGKTPISDGVTA